MPLQTATDPKVQFGTAVEIAAQVVQEAGVFSVDETGVVRVTKVDLTQQVVGGSGSVTGSGSTGYLARFVSASVLGSSQIFDDGVSEIAINAATNVVITASVGQIILTSSAQINQTAGTFVSIAGTTTVAINAGTHASLHGDGNAFVSAGGFVSIDGTGDVLVSSTAGSVYLEADGEMVLTTGTTFSVYAGGNVVIQAAGSLQISNTVGFTQIAGTTGTSVQGVVFLGVTNVVGLGAGLFGPGILNIPATAYATNLKRITAAGYPGVEPGAGSGGLVERLNNGVWYIPGTMIVAS